MKCTACRNTSGFTTRTVQGKPEAYQCNLCGHMWKKIEPEVESIFGKFINFPK